MRSEVLAAASVGLTALVLANAWVQRQQFYPSVVYITKSNPSMAVIYLQSLVLVILTGKLMRKLFFGQLRAAEFEHLMERSWYAVTETCLAFTVFKDDFSPKFVALFTLLLFLKSFHWLAEERVDYMERSPVIGLIFHLRVLSLALVLTSMDTFFIQHAYTSTLTKGASVQLVFGFEYAILLTIVMNTLVKYVLHSIDLHSENPWENKAVFVLYTELAVTLVRVLLYILFFVIMVRIYTLPLFAVRPMYLTMRAFKKAFNDVVLSRRAIHNMDTLYPDATAEELAATDNVCIICREEMTASSTKKLPCGHIFHRNCLRSWFQRQQTCPTCRLDVLRAAPTAPGPAPPQPAQAVFHQQMAALRAQLEAMQAQRQQGAAAPGAAAQGAAGAQQAAPAQAPAAVQQNLLQMMLAAQQAAQQAAAAPQQPAGAGAAAPRQQPQPAATSAAPTPAAAGASPLPPGGATGARPPFPFPPFPFLPFTTPPPMPPPNFEGLSTAELAAMEGKERTAVEARIRCLRNIQVLLDAAVMEMQQYSAVVARNSTHVPTPATIATTTTSSAASVASGTSTSSAANTTTTSSSTASIVSPATETTTTSTTSSLGSSSSASTSILSPVVPSTAEVDTAQISASTPATQETSSLVSASAATLNTSSETGARLKTSSNVSLEKKETDSEKEKNPFESLTKEEGSSGRTAEQEEMRRKRLAVFEEQKRRLMNQ